MKSTNTLVNIAAPTAWTLLDGVSHTTGSAGSELGNNIIVRIQSIGDFGKGVWFDEVSLTAIPDPSTALLGLATGAFALLRRRRRA